MNESNDLRRITNEELCKKYCAAYYCLDESFPTIESEMHRRGLTEQDLLEFGSIAGAKRQLNDRVQKVQKDIEDATPDHALRPVIRFATRCVVWLSRFVSWLTVRIEKVTAWLDHSRSKI